MKMRITWNIRSIAIAAVLPCAGAFTAAYAAPPQYQIYDIGVVDVGDTASQGFGVSDAELRSAVRYTLAAAKRLPGLSTAGSLACQTWRDAIMPCRTALTTLAASWGLLRPQPLAQAGCR